uniref:52 kDa repressor of the inhibitor of the protein kinase-like n=1 Tax=Diabrotica virgifera virgifera TaxID=50390 RepID=A0A6P7FAU0_DIAVI
MAARKGGISCVVRGCQTRSGEQISLFSIPRDRSRAELWLKAAIREDLLSKDVNELHKNYRMCEKHFQPHFISKGGNVRKNLFIQAHPTIFPYNQDVQSADEPLRKIIRLETQIEGRYSLFIHNNYSAS